MLVCTGQLQESETKGTTYTSDYYNVKVTEDLTNSAITVAVDFGEAVREMQKDLPRITVTVDNAGKSARIFIPEHNLGGELEYDGLGKRALGLQVAFAHMVEIDRLVTSHLHGA